MAVARTRFVVTVDGIPRQLFSVIEKKDGNLVVAIKHAGMYEDSEVEIREQRYSVHVSKESKEFTTLKQTLRLADGTEITSAALTDAVKLKTGYAYIYTKRCSILSSDRYVVPEDEGCSTSINLGEFDGAYTVLFYALLVGSIDADFKSFHPCIKVTQHCFAEFRFVILSCICGMLPLPSGDLIHTLTFRPEHAPDNLSSAFRDLMRGIREEDCFGIYQFKVNLLLQKYCHRLLGCATHPELIEATKRTLLALQTNPGWVPSAGTANTQVPPPTDEQPPTGK